MNLEDRVLGLVREKALPIYELQTKLQVSSVNTISVLAFLQKYKLVGVTPTSHGDTMIKITERGLQLLNLPSLPEDELPSNQLEILERHWGDEMEKALDREADLNLRQKEFSETIINLIKTREDRRQREIVGATK